MDVTSKIISIHYVELGKKPIGRYENDYGMPPCEMEKMKKVTTREQLSSKLSCVTLFCETLFNGSYNRGKGLHSRERTEIEISYVPPSKFVDISPVKYILSRRGVHKLRWQEEVGR